MSKSSILVLIALAAVAGLSACAKQTRVAQNQTGVCYTIAQKADGAYDYHPVKTGLTQMEQCAAALEVLRRNYLAIGGGQQETMGAFQGQFIFLQKDGIYTGDTLEGNRYLALVRTDDNRLVMPGAVVQEGQ